MSSMHQWLKLDCVHPRLGASVARAVIHELTGVLLKAYPQLDPNQLVESFQQREKVKSTAVLEGVAFPQAESDLIDHPILALACSEEGVHFESLDGLDTHLFIAIVTPKGESQKALQVLARLTRLFQSQKKLTQHLLEASDAERLFSMFTQAEEALGI